MATPKKPPSSSELERDKADQEGERTSKDEDIELTSAFERTVDEGERRLSRTWPGLLATGMTGGVDISVGLFALYIVDHKTHNPLLSALAFGIGFIALTLRQQRAVYRELSRSYLRSLFRPLEVTFADSSLGRNGCGQPDRRLDHDRHQS